MYLSCCALHSQRRALQRLEKNLSCGEAKREGTRNDEHEDPELDQKTAVLEQAILLDWRHFRRATSYQNEFLPPEKKCLNARCYTLTMLETEEMPGPQSQRRRAPTQG